jgi:hypothetical protein
MDMRVRARLALSQVKIVSIAGQTLARLGQTRRDLFSDCI